MAEQSTFDPWSQQDPLSIFDSIDTNTNNNKGQQTVEDPFDTLFIADTTNDASETKIPEATKPDPFDPLSFKPVPKITPDIEPPPESKPDPFAMFNDTSTNKQESNPFFTSLPNAPQPIPVSMESQWEKFDEVPTFNQQPLLDKITGIKSKPLPEYKYVPHTIHIGTFDEHYCPLCIQYVEDNQRRNNRYNDFLFTIVQVNRPNLSSYVKSLLAQWIDVIPIKGMIRTRSVAELLISGYMKKLQQILPVDEANWMNINCHRKDIFVHIPKDIVGLCNLYLYESRTAMLMENMKHIMKLETVLEWNEIKLLSWNDFGNDQAIKARYKKVMDLLDADRLINGKEKPENMALCNEMWMELNRTMNEEFNGIFIDYYKHPL